MIVLGVRPSRYVFPWLSGLVHWIFCDQYFARYLTSKDLALLVTSVPTLFLMPAQLWATSCPGWPLPVRVELPVQVWPLTLLKHKNLIT